MSAKFKDRPPHMAHLEKGDAWIFEDSKEPLNFGLNQCGGLPPERRVAWIRWEEARVGGYDPAVRLKEMDQDGEFVNVVVSVQKFHLQGSGLDCSHNILLRELNIPILDLC